MMRASLLLALLALLLAGCAAPAPATDETPGAGGLTPERAVEKFVDDLNAALADPALAESSVERIWAERLAGHFAPSERIDQRAAMITMLDRFSLGARQMADGQRVSVEVTYSESRILRIAGDEALVGLDDGRMTLRILNREGDLLRERSRALADMLSLPDGGFPVIRVGGRWFLTEG